MRNAYARLKEEFPYAHMQISGALGEAIRKGNQNSLNELITSYFSKPETSELLDGAIAFYIDDDEIPHMEVPAALAIMADSRNALRAILKATRNPNAREDPDAPENSPTLLMQAILSSNIDMVKLLLEEGADVNEEWVYINEDGEKILPYSALSWAVIKGLTKTANLLLDNGAISTPNNASGVITTSDGLDPLLVRMIELRPELMHEQTGNASVSLLHLAAMSNNLPSIKWLVERGANLNAIAEDGATPLDFAIYAEKKEIAAFLQSVGGVSGKKEELTESGEPTVTKQEITKIIERLELLEEKFGIAISGLYASYVDRPEYTYDQVTINFDLTSLNGGQLERSFSMVTSAYNSAGQLLETDKTHIDADDFMGFSPVSITLYLDQMPEKIRLFPAA